VTLGADLEAARRNKFSADVAKLKLLTDLNKIGEGVVLLATEEAMEQASGNRWSAFAARQWGIQVHRAPLTDEERVAVTVTRAKQATFEAFGPQSR